MKKLIYTLLFLLLPVFIMAGEFGLVMNQTGTLGSLEDGGSIFQYSARIVPRYMHLFGDGANSGFFVSAEMELKSTDEFYIIPKLLRTELFFQFGGLEIKAGRFAYSTPLSFIAEGLFDGAQVFHSSEAGRFSIGAWYTGYLYKKDVNIGMTTYDRDLNNVRLDYSDFTRTYFAPRRILASLDWEHLSIADILRLSASITTQFDLAVKEKYDSQYFTLKAGLPYKSFFFELGGCLSAAQPEDGDLTLSFAGDAGIFLTLPFSYNSRLSFNAQYASSDFVPIARSQTGNIFDARLSALTVLALNYNALFLEALGTNISARYFIRNNLTTKNTYPIYKEGNGHLLGAEFLARFIWTPFSDLYINFGGGVFVPSLGNNWRDDKPVILLELTVIFTAY
jgi:hypothetical protein